LAALAWVHFRETPAALQAVEFLLEPPPDSNFINQYGGFAASPDGRYVVFAARLNGPEFSFHFGSLASHIRPRAADAKPPASRAADADPASFSLSCWRWRRV